jgi:ammonium transporter Rh
LWIKKGQFIKKIFRSLLNADFATVSVIISLGAVIGKTSPLQLIVMAMIEIAIFATNEWFGLHVLKVSDLIISL